MALPACAEEAATDSLKPATAIPKIIGEIPASGLVFKDIVKVSRFSDPKVKGVELYVSDFQLPITERLVSGDIFSDPLSSSVTCVQTGPIVVDPSIKETATLQGEEVVSQARSLLFKSVRDLAHPAPLPPKLRSSRVRGAPGQSAQALRRGHGELGPQLCRPIVRGLAQ